MHPRTRLRAATFAFAFAVALLAGCASQPPSPTRASADEIRSQIVSLMPASVPDRTDWAVDIYAAFVALRIDPSIDHICSVLAVAEQESTFRADPSVPRLGALARAEIDRRAERAGVPRLVVNAALQLRSPDARTYSDRIDAARTERELSDVFEDFVDQVPLGRRLLGGYNPVRTGGPMQVSVDYAERHVKAAAYPYRMSGTVRDEVFSRRGGLYFGIAHLLDYPANYDRPIYRFADFNAGHYASRNAAFQNAVSLVSGMPLELDGDLVAPGADAARPGATESAVRAIGPRLGLGDTAIHRALAQDESPGLERTPVWERVFALADRQSGSPLPRAMLPRIRLQSPKITRSLTTEWFARRVDERRGRCVARAVAAARAS